MKIENVRVFGFENALRGMRNPADSWAWSDSVFYTRPINGNDSSIIAPEMPIIGPKDLDLACRLIRGGSEHRKFLRQIQVWCDISPPRFTWQEIDTYKVGTVRDSCSTMHKFGKKPVTATDFDTPIRESWIADLNADIDAYQALMLKGATPDAKREALRNLKGELPEGYMQRATYSFNYENALNMLHQRSDHRLEDWRLSDEGSFCQFLLSLPYMREFHAARPILIDAEALLAEIAEMCAKLSSGLHEAGRAAFEAVEAHVRGKMNVARG